MTIALVAVIILGAAGYHLLKGGIIRSFGMLIAALFAAFFAFGYFELLAGLLISYAAGNVGFIVPWAQALSFLLIFALSFSIMQAILVQLTRYEIDFGKTAEYIGRISLGIIIGFIFSGVVLTFLGMSPLSAKYPYPRFDENNPDAGRPKKVILNCDGFLSGLFGKVSSGSFSAFKSTHSFAALHPNYIDQLYLNRHGLSKNVPITSLESEITVPATNGSWQAGNNIKDTENNPVEAKGNSSLIVVRTGFRRSSGYQVDNSFVLSQLRLICRPKKEAAKEFAASAKNIYPCGYLTQSQVMQKAKLSEKISLTPNDLTEKLPTGLGKWIDFVFEVPNDYTPYAIELRQNSIAAVPAPVSLEKAPVTIAFIPASQCARDYAELSPVESSKIYGKVLTSQTRLLDDLPLSVRDQTDWNRIQTETSIQKARFNEEQITFVEAELKLVGNEATSTALAANKVSALLKPLDGYNILALKCNEPAAGVPIEPQKLPVLVELNGRVHHPAGVIAVGKSEESKIYEFDYCAETRDKNPVGLVIDENGAVAEAFPAKIWITEKAQSITAFYVLYLVKAADDVFITSVKPADAQTGAKFSKIQAFVVK
jgi:hypothetical protein